MPRPLRTLAVLVPLALTLSAAPAVAGTQEDRSALHSPTSHSRALHSPARHRVLPDQARGRAAVRALGDQLPAVAASNDLSAAHLKEVLTEDQTAWLTEEGQLYYQEAAPEEATAAPSTAAAAVAPTRPTSTTFSLHSRPSATRKIFLDFDGATVTNSAWNTATSNQIAPGTHIGYDVDGSPGTFNTAEHGFIQEVWRQVAESYAPFDVDVTTEDPGDAGITRASAADTAFGTRVLITSSLTPRAQACGGGCLGVAYVGTFDNVDPTGRYQPAWVFAYDKTFDPMIVAQAATHEAGHTLGLQHDGTVAHGSVPAADYTAGTSGWGPLMGAAMTRAVSQFSQGEYAYASNTQDDLAVIQSNGLPLRADDHGDSMATADVLGVSSSYAADGVISTRTDTDWFAITQSCVGDLTVAATGIGAQSALDLKVDVLNPLGATVGSSAPLSSYARGTSGPVSTGMDASVTVKSAAGTYFLKVDGVGNNGTNGSDWSDYGSLGQYHLTATGCSGLVSLPALPKVPLPNLSKPASPAPNAANPTPASEPPQNPARAKRPSAPRIGAPSTGARRGPKTAVARWAPPVATGGAAITKYRVYAYKLGRKNRVVRTIVSAYQRPRTRALAMALPAGKYVFRVVAFNRAGASPASRASRVARAR